MAILKIPQRERIEELFMLVVTRHVELMNIAHNRDEVKRVLYVFVLTGKTITDGIK